MVSGLNTELHFYYVSVIRLQEQRETTDNEKRDRKKLVRHIPATSKADFGIIGFLLMRG